MGVPSRSLTAKAASPLLIHEDSNMLRKLSIMAVAAWVLMIPTTLTAQMGGAVNPGVNVGRAVNPGPTVRGAVERGIPGPDMGTWRSPSGPVHGTRRHTVRTIKQRR